MYTNFKDLYKAYGFYNPKKSRGDLSLDEERQYVNDCFNTYEYIGFANKFGTPYPGAERYKGMTFKVLSRVKEYPEDENGADLEVLPAWNIQMENGDIIVAYPEEICIKERRDVDD